MLTSINGCGEREHRCGMGSIPVNGDGDMNKHKWLKWSVVIILMLAIGKELGVGTSVVQRVVKG